MAGSLTETETPQTYTHEETDNDEDNSLEEEAHPETVDEIIAHKDVNIGNWADLIEPDTLPNENEEPEEPTPVVAEKPPVITEKFTLDLALVLGSELMMCQLPKDPPFNAVIFQVPDGVTEEELYMLFGGKRAIESHMYRRDLREILFTFRRKGHLINALLKESMVFKEKPLRIAVILVGNQIAMFNYHNKIHTELDLKMIPFRNAFEKCYERLEDGSFTELFDDTMSVDMESISSGSQIPPYTGNDVRFTQPHQVINRQRNESITSMASIKSASEHGPPSQSISRQSSYQPSETDNYQKSRFPPQQSQQPPQSPVSKRPPFQKSRGNPFGDAKPVNTDKKVLSMQEKLMTQKSIESQKGVAPMPTDFHQPPPQIDYRFPHPNMAPGTIKIQKRERDALPPAHNGQMQWTNSSLMTQGPPPTSFRPPLPPGPPSHPVNIGGDMVDFSKPPPEIGRAPQHLNQNMPSKPTHPSAKPKRERPFNKKGGNYQPNGFSSHLQKQASINSQNFSSHQSLPPAALNRRKSSTDQKIVSEVLPTEKSQSAPVSHETVAVAHISPRSSPSGTFVKRPNSANSSMSFVTAHSGSEMSSTMSTDLPGVPSSIDSICERLSEVEDDHRRHSWEGRNSSPSRKKEQTKKKNSLGSKRGKKPSGEFRKPFDSDNLSRRSSASTPQYQSASNVFLDVSESSETTEKAAVSGDAAAEFEHKAVIKAKNGLEKRAPSLPLSRPHTSSNEKTTNTPKQEPNKSDSLSAPPTPSGSTKKKSSESRKKENKRKSTAAALVNNKFHALLNAPQ